MRPKDLKRKHRRDPVPPATGRRTQSFSREEVIVLCDVLTKASASSGGKTVERLKNKFEKMALSYIL